MHFDKALLIHHWDTDGICSAKILLENFKGIRANITPIIGNYFLTEREMGFASGFDSIIIADMALPEKNIYQLKRDSEVLIYDHHIQDQLDVKLHENPISRGRKPNEYPSTSYVITRFLGKPVDLYALLGAVGDREEKLKENPIFWQILKRFLRDNELTFKNLLKMAEMLDSIYRVGDKEGVEHAPHLLIEHTGPEYIMKNKEWANNIRNLEEKMEEIMTEPPVERGGLLFKKINTPYNLISRVTRKIAWEEKRDTLVINTGYTEEYAQIYVRSPSKDMSRLIQYFKGKGYSAGGKRGVMGLVIPIKNVDNAISKIINHLKSQQ